MYDGKSPLEQMHVQLLLRVMRAHGLGIVVDTPKTGCRARKLLTETVLATDMSVHELFMRNFQLLADGAAGPICLRQIFTCQALMKCADISNPVRDWLCCFVLILTHLNHRAVRSQCLGIGQGR